MKVKGLIGALGLSALLWTPSVMAAPQNFTLGMFLDWGSTQSSQVKTLMQQIVRLTSKRLGVTINLQYFSHRDPFLAQVKAGKLDLVYTSDLPSPSGLRPLVGLKLYGKGKVRNCFFVRKDKPFKTWKDLKGKSLMTYGMPAFFFSLREIVGEPVLHFSRQVQAAKSSLSPFYALSLDQIDGAFVSEVEMAHLQTTSPGAVKDIRFLTCSAITNSFPPLLVKPNFPPDLSKKLLNAMVNVQKDPLFKDFLPLLKKAGVIFEPYQPSSMTEFNALMAKGKKFGWEKEFYLWRNLTSGQ